MSHQRDVHLKMTSITEESSGERNPNRATTGGRNPAPARTPMGEYIVPQGSRPLTSLGDAAPGPADYSPTVVPTKTAAPQFSIVGRTKEKYLTDAKSLPGPSEYDTSGDISWKNKRLTLKGKAADCQLEKQAASSNSNLGKYMVEYLTIGKQGPKFKIGIKAASSKPAGYDTPGPNYRPNSAYWGRGSKKSFGTHWKRFEQRHGPGPADYDIPSNKRGPSHSFGMKLPPTHTYNPHANNQSPASNTYSLQTTIGKAPAVSLTGRAKTSVSRTAKEERDGPCPFTYNPRIMQNNTNRATTLGYKWFENNETYTNRPGPADYRVYPVNLKKSPEFSCRQRTNHSYPESIKYENEDRVSPGPGSYSLVKEFVQNDSPAFSFRSRPPQDARQNKLFPGPNAYYVEKDRPEAKRAPKYSMGRRSESRDHFRHNPGPAEYNPQLKKSGPRYTMTKRPKGKGSFVNPAPNNYILPEEITGTNKGVVLKSRCSPYVYNGHRSNKLEEPRKVSLPVYVVST